MESLESTAVPSRGTGYAAALARRAAWAPAGVFAVHLVAARVLGLYEAWPPIDIPAHLMGGVAIAFFFGASFDLAVERGWFPPLDRRLRFALWLGLTALAAIGWEAFEYVATIALFERGIPGYEDTLADLLLGLVGGAAYGAVDFRRRR